MSTISKIIAVVLISLLTAGCSPLKFAAVNAPALSYKGDIITDVAYGSGPSHKLDIYIPDIDKDSLPVVIFFHGGRWTDGSKDQYKFVGMTLSNLGYVVVLPNTRLYPKVRFPSFVEDSAEAIAWVHKNIERYKGSDDLFVSGHSSGAHMGALVIADESYLAAHDLSPNIVNAFAGMSGPYDFTPKAADIKKIFGPPENYPKMAVTNFIDGNEAPMLLIYTREDKTVHPRNLALLKQGIERANGQVQSIIYERGGHAASVAAFTWANPSDLPVPDDIDEFFRKHLR